VSDAKSDTPRPFDVNVVETLLKLMSAHDLAEVDLAEGDKRIRLRKADAFAPRAATAPVAYALAPVPAAGAPAASQSAAPQAPAAPAKNLIEIKSPMVGTFYAKPKPDKPDYVSVGSKVAPKTVVCQLEAMKLFNEITADCTGTVAEVCVKNGDAVEYDQVLFRIDPA
jgi:acetyl-CoA carboxylase biotin carboxyl carrier protein